MRIVLLLAGLIASPSVSFAVSETICEIEIACAQTEPCNGPMSGLSTPAQMRISSDGALILDHGHRVAVFDRVQQLEDGRVFAQSLPAGGERQEMLSIAPDGVFILTIHDPAGPGISITAFGKCQEMLKWTS